MLQSAAGCTGIEVIDARGSRQQITKETVKGAPSPNARRLNMTVNKELFVSIVGDVAPGWPSP